MRATLIYNQRAGGVSQMSVDELIGALKSSGYSPVYKATSDERDLDAVLEDATGLFVVAGGDGTLRAVATRIIGKPVTLCPLPLGTANNICRDLCVEGTPLEIIAGLDAYEPYLFDVGRVDAPWGQALFFEAFGCGLYADALATYQPEQGKSVLRALQTLSQTLVDVDTYRWKASLDGEDISGHYLLLEVLNTTAVGPRLTLAPEARTDDGLLDVVRVHHSEGVNHFEYAASLINQRLEHVDGVQVMRGQRLELHWSGFDLHLDGEVYSAPKGWTGPATLYVEVVAGALEFWLPKGAGRG